MSSLFGNFADDPRIQKQALKSRYSAARMNFLLFIIFSAVNLIMLAIGTNTYFLFSATVPYLIVQLAKVYCGMLPPEYYTGELAGMEVADKSFFYISLGAAALVLVIYLLCWILSKKNNVRWLTIGLVLIIFDTVLLVLNSGLASIIDLIFHIWMIVIIWIGIKAHSKLKSLPKDEPIIEGEFRDISDEGCDVTEDFDAIASEISKDNEENE